MGDPPRADIRLGYLCNHNCMFCCVSDHRKENMSTAEAMLEIRRGKEFGAEKIAFTGGEPTIRKDIFRLVKYAKELGFSRILVISNGQMCSYPEFLDRLIDSGLNELGLSYPDYREKVYERLTRSNGSFSRLVKAIENARRYRIQLSTVTIINKLNYRELAEITEALIAIKRKHENFFSEFIFINPTNNAWRNRAELVPRVSECAPFIHQSIDIAKQNGLALNIEGVPLCYMQGYFPHVVEFHMAKMRRFFEDGLEDREYNESRKNMGKVKAKTCLGCQYDRECEGIWKGYVDIYGGSELHT